MRRGLGERLRRRMGAAVVDGFFNGAARGARLHPDADPRRHGVEVVRDLPYTTSGRPEHLLDIYRPIDRSGPLPVVLYVHGGGFRILSKDTHWIMALAFARHGMVVFNINYRLAPRHRYPAALEDTCAAWEWVLEHAAEHGGDPRRVVVAGESAGANLITALTVTTSYRRPEPWARRVFERARQPTAAVAQCGLLQVSNVRRFRERRPDLSRFLSDRMEEVEEAYLGRPRPAGPSLADPLLVLESGPPDRSLPPFFASVGTRDPLLDDTRRLEVAVSALGARCEARYYPDEVHAFQAFVFRRNARRCWGHTYRFLDEVLG